MSQPTIDESVIFNEVLEFIFDNRETQTSTERNNMLSQHDGNETEGRYEIETDEINMILFPEQLFRDIIGDTRSMDQFPMLSPSTDLMQDLLVENNEVLPSTESNDIDEPIQNMTDERLAMIKTANPTIPINRPQNEKIQTKVSSDQSINLSLSVAVTTPTPNSLQLVYPLEDIYRPRYKSDYFPSKGAVRRPRYVSDNAGHHYVSLLMPTEFSRDWINKYVRVALLTVPLNGQGHLYSPYNFQQDHNELKVPDENPIFLPVKQFDGIMRLHLVLIKSKLDQLNHAQPLKPFSDTAATVQNIIPQAKLPPKDLIAKYQLDKSHIAFTLCSKSSDGTYEIHPETTTISSVIAEVPNKSTSNPNNKTSEKTTSSTEKKISCPHCSHCFEINEEEIKSTGKKRSSTAKSSTNHQPYKKQKN